MSERSMLYTSLVGLSLEGLFYGVFLLLFSMMLFMFLQNSEAGRDSSRWKDRSRTPLFVTAVIFSLTISAHWVISVYRAYCAFAYYKGGSAPLELYSNLDQLTSIANMGLSYVTILIGDAALIYRLWVLWDFRREVACLSVLGFCATLACCIGAAYQSEPAMQDQSAFLARSIAYIRAAVVLVLCTTSYTSAIIVWRLWHYQHAAQQNGAPKWASQVLIQSAAIYVGWLLLYFILFFARSDVRFIIIDLASPITGIAFMLISILVFAGWEDERPPTRSANDVSSDTQPTESPAINSQDKLLSKGSAMSSLEAGEARAAVMHRGD